MLPEDSDNDKPEVAESTADKPFRLDYNPRQVEVDIEVQSIADIEDLGEQGPVQVPTRPEPEPVYVEPEIVAEVEITPEVQKMLKRYEVEPELPKGELVPYELRKKSEEEEAPKPIINTQYHSDYVPEKVGLMDLGTPEELIEKLGKVGYEASLFNATQISLMLNTPATMIRTLLFEGPPGCGKTFVAKSLAKITGAELMVMSCYPDMNTAALIESPSMLGVSKAMAGQEISENDLVSLGILSRAYLKSQTKPVILLIDEIDKAEDGVDTFFLGPLNDARLWLESRAPIDANIDNILIIFTKNFNRNLDDALMRRCTPIVLSYLDSELERRVMAPHVDEVLCQNISFVADTIRSGDGAYKFERSPAPDELLKCGRYIAKLIEWGHTDFAFVGESLWPILAKGESDREVLDLLLRFHPEFADALIPDPRQATQEQIYAKLGRVVLRGIVEDPEAEDRRQAYQVEKVGFQHVGDPDEIVSKLADVGYECLPYLALQIGLVLNTPRGMVKTVMLEGPPGCGKSFMAKCLARITGAEMLVLQCYKGMRTQELVESRNEVAIAQASAGVKVKKEDIMELGVLSRAFQKSKNQPVILLIDEIDKVDIAIDTFFLGPIQDGRIWLQSGPPIDANMDNLLIFLTKNHERSLNDALLRRVHPISMTYLDAKLERKILRPHCIPRLVDNLSSMADIMRYSNASYQFDRPPAPEELLTTARYISKLLEWGEIKFDVVGGTIWNMLCKSEHDRAVLDHMLRHHPDFMDPLIPNGRNAPIKEIYARLGRFCLEGIIEDPRAKERESAWAQFEYN